MKIFEIMMKILELKISHNADVVIQYKDDCNSYVVDSVKYDNVNNIMYLDVKDCVVDNSLKVVDKN